MSFSPLVALASVSKAGIPKVFIPLIGCLALSQTWGGLVKGTWNETYQAHNGTTVLANLPPMVHITGDVSVAPLPASPIISHNPMEAEAAYVTPKHRDPPTAGYNTPDRAPLLDLFPALDDLDHDPESNADLHEILILRSAGISKTDDEPDRPTPFTPESTAREYSQSRSECSPPGNKAETKLKRRCTKKTKRRWSPRFKCSQCSYTTNQEYVLKRHLNTHIPESLRPKSFCCDQCNYITNRGDAFNRHLKVHLPAGTRIKPHQCNQCHYRTDQKCKLNRHLNTHKQGNTPFRCHQCGTTRARLDLLNQHMKIHQPGGDQDPIRCNQCNYTTDSPSNLKMHMRTHIPWHQRPKSFQCPHCNYKTDIKYSLQRHIKTHRS